MSITIQQATVYYAPTAGRRYFTKEGAISGEAKALIRKKYPTEDVEHDERGQVISPGFHWTSLDHADALYERLCSRIKRCGAFKT